MILEKGDPEKKAKQDGNRFLHNDNNGNFDGTIGRKNPFFFFNLQLQHQREIISIEALQTIKSPYYH